MSGEGCPFERVRRSSRSIGWRNYAVFWSSERLGPAVRRRVLPTEDMTCALVAWQLATATEERTMNIRIKDGPFSACWPLAVGHVIRKWIPFFSTACLARPTWQSPLCLRFAARLHGRQPAVRIPRMNYFWQFPMTLKGSAAAVIRSVVRVKMVRVLRWQAGSQRLLRWRYVPSWLRAPNLVDWEIATGLVVADFVACCHRIRTCCHHLFRTARQFPNHAQRTVGTSKHWTKFTSEIDCTQNLDQGRPVSKQTKKQKWGTKNTFTFV